MDILFSQIINFVIATISEIGLIGVALLMAIESAAIPLPSEIIMPFAGFLVSMGKFSLLSAAFAGAIGSVFGSLVIYQIAAVGGRPLVNKYGRYIFISPKDLKKTEKFFIKHGVLATFIGRMLPVIRTYISVPAGLAKMPLIPFISTAFIGSFFWSYFLAYLGLKVGQHWSILHERFRGLEILIIALLVVLAIWYLNRHLREIRLARIDKSREL